MFISVVELFHQPIFDNVTSSSALVMWQSPGGNVDKYIVQYVLAHDGCDSGRINESDVKNITVNGSDTHVVVGNLLPKSTYNFRVAARNSHGISMFSQYNSFSTKCESLVSQQILRVIDSH